MLFSEIYSTYFTVVSNILKYAANGTLDRETLLRTVQEKGFGESLVTIPDALASGKWPLLGNDFSTVLRGAPEIPLSLLEKRWLKTILSDPRIRLFEPDPTGIEDVEPLFDLSSVVYYDRYADGDPYDDPAYVRNFRLILQAIREKKRLLILFRSGKGKEHRWNGVPYRIEYSKKDDKFRLLLITKRNTVSVNIARIVKVSLSFPYEEREYIPHFPPKETVTFLLTDERNALERVMLGLSDLEKITEKLDDKTYRVTLRYEKEDETEILIRLLSYGPMVRVVSPDAFRMQIRERIEKQLAL